MYKKSSFEVDDQDESIKRKGTIYDWLDLGVMIIQ